MNHSSINYEKDVHKWEEVLLNKPKRIREKSYSTLYRNNGNGIFEDILDWVFETIEFVKNEVPISFSVLLMFVSSIFGIIDVRGGIITL